MGAGGLFDGFDERFVDVGDVALYCVVAGGGPPVLLLHGDYRAVTLPGAHFFVDQFPAETAAIVADFLGL